MARLLDDTASQYLVGGAPVTAAPLMVAAWFRTDDVTINQAILSLSNNTDSAKQMCLLMRGATSGDPITWSVRNSGPFQEATSTTGVTVNTWHHAVGIEITSSDRVVMLDGGSTGTDVGAAPPAGINAFDIGRLGDSTPSSYFSGRIAEVGVWDLTNWGSTDAERKAAAQTAAAKLAAGISPLAFPIGLVGYWPLWGLHSPEIDLHPRSVVATDYSLTVSGATAANHAPVIPFSRRLWTSTVPEIGAAAAATASPKGAISSIALSGPLKRVVL